MRKIRTHVMTVALLAGLGALAFAADKNEGNFTLTDTVRVGSTDLKAGRYKAEWKAENNGAVKVDILQHGKVVATADGKLKTLPSRAPYDAVVTKPVDNNAKAIDEIDFNNRTEALVLGE